MRVSSAYFVISKLGGLTKTANALGLGVTTVQGWKDRDRIPPAHWRSVIACMEESGETFTVDDFLEDHEMADEENAA